MSNRALSLLFVPALAACDDVPPEQLEALDADIHYDTGMDLEHGQYEGTLSVEGSEADYTLTLTDSSGETTLTFEAHSSGGFDLSQLAGERRQVNLLGGGIDDHVSVVVQDEQGPMWVADIGDRADAVSALIGGSPVHAGDVVAKVRDENWSWSYTTLVVPTDEGDVELLPGEVETVSIDGVLWRFVPVAAYDREPQEDAILPDCSVMSDMLAYEMLRVEAREASDLLERPAGLKAAALGCGG